LKSAHSKARVQKQFAMSAECEASLYVVGYNPHGQLGLGHCDHVNQITKWATANEEMSEPMSVRNTAHWLHPKDL
jgi:alpha-tubulin suppressor-like RCC1 family protein